MINLYLLMILILKIILILMKLYFIEIETKQEI
uniref:Uncharacterized protein n=1 Tax=viral metagenome TaxID=1070528 RepID=A0A6C0H964_9ZZZZ